MFECLIQPTVTMLMTYSQDVMHFVPGCKAKDDIYQIVSNCTNQKNG